VLYPAGRLADEEPMSDFDRDNWNAEAVFTALQPWELDVIERGLTCLAALASTHPDWDHVHGQEARAMAIVAKLNRVAEFQGYEGGLEGVRAFLEDGRAEIDGAGA
jgi:hypothetical protein